MLDTDTKRRIDTARDILVGKVPDPKSQVEQITIALIYKFMDDMDAEAEELGGRRKFFAGEYARYGWAKLMRSGLGGHETLNLYAEAIAKMPENPGIPPLFRDIFKNAFLPYRDPETLRAFLKIIDEFEYDHSERLGDAFEYLLSVLGSQGDAGQFRTPRHIIDFIVAIIDPKKTDTVLDPACGTAGFLISSFKHILRANMAKVEGERMNDESNANSSFNIHPSSFSTLTPDERGRLAANFKGYDISPDMVRLSLVNLYLHGFTDPHIFEYDTLTSQDRWNDYADVILANPPFMSPKGGIKPHNRFSVQSKRSEVLFVDYMAEHLTPSGRAGIIVPEGIIFQSQTVYTQLRKMLVEDYLVAVVSLPAGVFNPYSGVKTSILILDKALAKQAGSIAFFKIENDGFNLGAQRRPIDKDDLPQARAEIAEYLRRLRARESVDDFQPTLGLVVSKEKIAANGDYNLSGERYRENAVSLSAFPFVQVEDVFQKVGESVLPETLPGPVTYIGLENITQSTGKLNGAVVTETPADIKSLKNVFRPGDILYGKLRPNLNKVWLADRPGICSTDIFVVRSLDGRTLAPLYAHIFLSTRFNNAVISELKGAQLPRIGWTSFAALEIPLPPLEVQKEIVEEIEGYQRVIDGARAVLDNYRPHIPTSWIPRHLDVEERLKTALDTFIRRDSKLIDLNANERSMTAKIADYLQDEFPEWDVDHEYNRDENAPKRDTSGTLTTPDIIIHRRGTNENFIVIEIKKERGGEDLNRLREIATQRSYHYAFAITIDRNRPTNDWINPIIYADVAPQISIHPAWPMVELGEVIEDKPRNGYSGRPVDRVTDTKVLTLSATTSGKLDLTKFKYLDEEIPMTAACRCRRGDIYLQRGNTAELVGTAALFDVDEPGFIYPDLMIRVRADSSKIVSHYLLIALQSQPVRDFLMQNAVGAAGSMPKINQSIVERIPIPLPPIDTQRAIVAEIEAEQALVNANRELIARMEKKIQATLARVWGENE
ncbi:MAG: N-6 DNA methylase [Alphaproteobacteria bacterium]|uniref:site-specific DNA-methyltransferase (adenine-specific) n=1 Tax=Candidatus Nitrobium versatile TaxID=2884831 RepID=A0A953SHW0_9BACT|nr:N-6 DNA methylase [Candidatus Nitrobium versatile]